MRPTLRQLTQFSLAALFALVGADVQLPSSAAAPSATPALLAPGSWSSEGLQRAPVSTDFQLEPDADFETSDQGDIALEALGERWQSWTLYSTIVAVERPPAIHSRPGSCHTPRAPPRSGSLA